MPTHAISVDGNPANSNTGDAPSSSPYLSYVAILYQSGLANPEAYVMNANDTNYLGDVTWVREAEGYYVGTRVGAFTVDKTWMSIQQGSYESFNSIANNSQPDAIGVVVTVGGIPTDGYLPGVGVELRVYQ